MKSKLLIYWLVVALVASLAFSAYASESTGNGQSYANGRVIVKFEKNLPEQAKNAHRNEAGIEKIRDLKMEGLELAAIKGNRSVEEVIEKLDRKNGVLYAEPDYRLTADEIFPSDPYFSDLWGLHNANDIDIDAPEAWDMETGDASVIVAVIDTGIQTGHPDLTGNFVAGYDFYNHDASVYDGPDDDHGTHVAGTILANWNSIGVAGIAPGVKIMPIKFLGPDGGYTSDAILAINYAKVNGAFVINASWGGGGYSTALKEAIAAFGGPFVAAAGNSRTNTDRKPHYPSSYDCPNIISVAAIDRDGSLASFSNYGLETVDVAAPGVAILSTVPVDDYAYYNGTSMATPHVTGIVALMKSADSELSTQALMGALYESVKPLEALAGKTATGGLVSASGALTALGEPVLDTIPPIMTGTQPENGASGVGLDTVVKVSFNEPIRLADSLGITVNGAPAAAHASGNDLIIDMELAYDSVYAVGVSVGSVEDTAGNSYASEIAFSFTTESEPAPVPATLDILRTKPRDGSVNVKTTAVIEIYFADVFTEINTSMISLETGESGIEITPNGEGTGVLTIKPQALDSKTVYTLYLGEGAVFNGSAVSAPYELSFTTGK